MARRKNDGTARSSQERTAAQIRTERAKKDKKIKETKQLLLGTNLSIRDQVKDINMMIANNVSQGRITTKQRELESMRETARMHADALKALRAA